MIKTIEELQKLISDNVDLKIQYIKNSESDLNKSTCIICRSVENYKVIKLILNENQYFISPRFEIFSYLWSNEKGWILINNDSSDECFNDFFIDVLELISIILCLKNNCNLQDW